MKAGIKELGRLQNVLWKKISLRNSFADITEIKLVAGVDIAYWSRENIDYGVCSIVIMDYQSKSIIERVEHAAEVTFPYMSGYLAFREMPLVMETVGKMSADPDLYMFDGNGYLHERHMGMATHASFELKKPTIGVAKTYYKVSDTDFAMPENKAGMFTDIDVGGEIYGRALRTRENVKPVFVSCGNWIDMDTATMITMNFIEHDSRLPTPIRYADLASREARRKLLGHAK